MSDLGAFDLACDDDLLENMGEVSGAVLFAQAIVRRLNTPRGMLIDDKNYGLDLAIYLSKGLTPEQIAAMPGEVRAETMKDERVEAVEVTTVRRADDEIVLRARANIGNGPFEFTMSVSAAGVKLLEVT